MPANPRQYWKRELERSRTNIDMCLSHLLAFKTEYEPVHPEYAEAVEVAMTGLLQMQEYIKSIENQV